MHMNLQIESPCCCWNSVCQLGSCRIFKDDFDLNMIHKHWNRTEQEGMPTCHNSFPAARKLDPNHTNKILSWSDSPNSWTLRRKLESCCCSLVWSSPVSTTTQAAWHRERRSFASRRVSIEMDRKDEKGSEGRFPHGQAWWPMRTMGAMPGTDVKRIAKYAKIKM